MSGWGRVLYSYNSTSIWPVPDQLRALLVPCVILGELFSIWAIWGRPLSVPSLIRTTAKQARLNMGWIWLLWVLGEYWLNIIELWTWAVSPLYVHNVQPPWAPLSPLHRKVLHKLRELCDQPKRFVWSLAFVWIDRWNQYLAAPMLRNLTWSPWSD